MRVYEIETMMNETVARVAASVARDLGLEARRQEVGSHVAAIDALAAEYASSYAAIERDGLDGPAWEVAQEVARDPRATDAHAVRALLEGALRDAALSHAEADLDLVSDRFGERAAEGLAGIVARTSAEPVRQVEGARWPDGATRASLVEAVAEGLDGAGWYCRALEDADGCEVEVEDPESGLFVSFALPAEETSDPAAWVSAARSVMSSYDAEARAVEAYLASGEPLSETLAEQERFRDGPLARLPRDVALAAAAGIEAACAGDLTRQLGDATCPHGEPGPVPGGREER